MDKIICYLQKKYKGKWMDIYNFLKERREANQEEVKEMDTKDYITLLSDNYPDYLKEIIKPPFMVMKNDNKYYYVYGENLNKCFEIVDFKDSLKTEKEYIKLLTKYNLQ